MTREEVFAKLTDVFHDVFDDDSIVLSDSTTSNDVEDWDSLEHINLVNAVEKKFSVKFNMGEVNSMKNVGEMVDVIIERVK